MHPFDADMKLATNTHLYYIIYIYILQHSKHIRIYVGLCEIIFSFCFVACIKMRVKGYIYIRLDSWFE